MATQYTVKEGDTLNKIASQFGYENYKTAGENISGYDTTNPDLLSVGTKLNVNGYTAPNLAGPVDVSSLSPSGLTPPNNQITDPYAGLGAGASTYMTSSQDATKTNQDAGDAYLKNLSSLEGVDAGQIQTDLETKYGLTEKATEARKIKALVEANTAEAEAARQTLESGAAGKDVTTGFLGKQQQEISRQEAIRNLPLVAKYQAAQGDFQAAQDTVTKLYTARLRDEEAKYDRKLELIKAAYAVADTKEKRMLDAKAKEEERKYNTEKDTLAFEREKELARYKKGLETGATPGGPLQLAQNEGNIQNINEILNSGGLKTSVGTNFLTKAPSGFWGSLGAIASVIGIPSFLAGTGRKMTGEKQNFISAVEQVQSQLSIDSLIKAKAQGATFGALSDSELRVLSNSASKLGSWAIKDSKGNVTGYNTSEKEFRKELDKINNFAKLDYIVKGGDPANIGAQLQSDGSIWTQNNDGTYTKIK